MCEVMRAPFLAMGSLAMDEYLLVRLQQVADDGQVGGLHGAAGGTAAVALGSLRSTTAASAHSAIAGLLGLSVTFAGGGLVPGGLVFILVEPFVVLAVLVVEVQLDAVVEVGFLEHLAQVAGTHLRGQRLLFKVVQLIFLGLAMMMAGSIGLFFIDEFLHDQAAAGGIG